MAIAGVRLGATAHASEAAETTPHPLGWIELELPGGPCPENSETSFHFHAASTGGALAIESTVVLQNAAPWDALPRHDALPKSQATGTPRRRTTTCRAQEERGISVSVSGPTHRP